jgi:hypothetical protein
MKKLFSVLTVLLLFAGLSEVKAQANYTPVPYVSTTATKYRIVYTSDAVIFQDTTNASAIKTYKYKKVQIRPEVTKYTGGILTVYAAPPSTKVIFRAPVSAFKITGIANTDSARVVSIINTL